MNFAEALQAVWEGKRVRNKGWASNVFINNNGGIRYCNNTTFDLSDLTSHQRNLSKTYNEWEIYKNLIPISSLVIGDKFELHDRKYAYLCRYLDTCFYTYDHCWPIDGQYPAILKIDAFTNVEKL